ncbi:MAG: hypothetical protein QY332_11230 [Anaerolineales bacterium]|nr:MAG: hypothetical protein QY332_11230 [Anaerolineales bacterium]
MIFFADRSAALKRLRNLIPSGGRFALANWQEIEKHDLSNESAVVESRHLAPRGVSYDDLVARTLRTASAIYWKRRHSPPT